VYWIVESKGCIQGKLGRFIQGLRSRVRVLPHNEFDYLLYKKGLEVRRRWLIDMLKQQGPCAKIAYQDGRPFAQIQFCPEEMMPHVSDPRKDVVSILCTYSPIPEAQRKGGATTLVKTLLEECDSGQLFWGDALPLRCDPTIPRGWETISQSSIRKTVSDRVTRRCSSKSVEGMCQGTSPNIISCLQT